MPTIRTTAQILRDYRGPALFSFGFRPFFLLAALWAAIAVPVWTLSFVGAGVHVPLDWHVHEMLFGYTGAVIVGYMIVAGANWTGHYPVAGWPVAALAGLWIAGRLTTLAALPGGPLPAAFATMVDSAFLLLFAVLLWREQIAASNWRSLAPCVVISMLAVADLLHHFAGEIGQRLAIGAIAFLIALMGGRLVPSFTRNWMAQRRIAPEPAPQGRLDLGVLGAAGLGMALWVVAPQLAMTAAALTLAGIGLFVRLLRWRGWATGGEAMVWVLHLGYFWCALGFALLGLSILAPAMIPPSSAFHALTTGAIGVMTLAVMTRTSRSHTGRERVADRLTGALYLCINLAAALRVAAPFTSDLYLPLIVGSALVWTMAFLLFVIGYGPMLTGPRYRKIRKPG